MGYVAVRGGEEAIKAAREFARYLRVRRAGDEGRDLTLGIEQIRDQMRLAVDRVLSEGSLYAPDYAALALKQAEGDTLEAAFILRAYRSSLPRALRADRSPDRRDARDPSHLGRVQRCAGRSVPWANARLLDSTAGLFVGRRG